MTISHSREAVILKALPNFSTLMCNKLWRWKNNNKLLGVTKPFYERMNDSERAYQNNILNKMELKKKKSK